MDKSDSEYTETNNTTKKKEKKIKLASAARNNKAKCLNHCS